MDQHLNDDQIAALLEANREQPDDPVLEYAKLHLRDCDSCSRQFREQESAMERLERVKRESPAPRKPECPPLEIWLEIVAGTRLIDSQHFLSHALECDHCGPKLKEAMADLASEFSLEENAEISNLLSADNAWQKEMARELSQRSRRANVRSILRRRLLPISIAIAASILLAAFFMTAHRIQQPRDVEALLARAYSDNRTLELRIAGADRVPLHVERGANHSLITDNPTLLQAEALIGSELRLHPDDRHWLEMKARADLLSWNYQAALSSLAEAQSETNPNALIDVATAYFERAEVTHRDEDYGQALEILGRRLDRDPADEIALFNKAIVLERLRLFSGSIEAWQQFLSLHPKSQWISEANDHITRIQALIKNRTELDRAPLLDPDAFLMAERMEAEFDLKVRKRLEDYIEHALSDWLLLFYKESHNIRRNNRTCFVALRVLSNEAAKDHNDRFLQDLISDSSKPGFASAMRDLGNAIKQNRSGRQDEAIELARSSEVAFTYMGSTAGSLRARFEIAYGSQLSLKIAECHDAASLVVTRSRERGYEWLLAQSLIEQAFCSNIAGRVGDAAIESTEAMNVARTSGFHQTLLRASLGRASIDWEAGSVAQAWLLIMDSLREYWGGGGSRARALAFYSLMDAIAEYDGRGYLQSAAIREYLPMVQAEHDPVQTILSWYRLGNAELETHHDAEARRAFQTAESTLASAPKSMAAKSRQILGVVGLAKIDLQEGKQAECINLLSSIEPSISTMKESLGVLDFYNAMGDAEARAGRYQEAIKAYNSAISISERALSTLANPQDRMSWIRAFTPSYRGLVRLRLELGDAWGALDQWESYRAIALKGVRTKRPITGRVPSRLSSAHRASLIYATLGNRSVVWAIGPAGRQWKWLELTPAELGRIVEQYLYECANPKTAPQALQAKGRALYRVLIQPVASSVEAAKYVWIEPDGLLETLPVDALLEPDGTHFGARHIVNYSANLRSDIISREATQITKNSNVLVLESALEDPVKGMLPDPGEQEEAVEVASRFRRARVFHGESIERTEFDAALLHSQIFHYVGHAESSNETRLAMHVSDGRTDSIFLDAEELYSHPLFKCSLAVLSGCATSPGEDGMWIDRNSLILPFLNSGADCVIASRWAVDSSTTAILMRSFYDQLLSGQAIPEALATAKRRVQADASTANPYYWASFDAFGPCRSIKGT